MTVSKFKIGKAYIERHGVFRTKWTVTDRRETVSVTGRTVVTIRLEDANGQKISSRAVVRDGAEVCHGGYYGFLRVPQIGGAA